MASTTNKGQEELFVYVAPHRREVHPSVKRGSEMFFGKGARGIFMLFAKPCLSSYPAYITPKDPTQEWKKVSNRDIQRRDCWILRLPAETIVKITTEIHIIDALHLGLTCRHLWEEVWPMIISFVFSSLGVWAGTPIICMGNWHRRGSNAPYPGKLVPRTLQYEMEQGLCWDRKIQSQLKKHLMRAPYNLAELAFERFDRVRDIAEDNLPPDLIVPAKRYLNSNDYSPADVVWFLNQCPYKLYNAYPDDIWVLRSLTAREFIRSTSIAIHPGYICGPFILGIGFSEAICRQTMYTSGPFKGSWAGHALDIVPFSRLQKDGGLWVDIGDHVGALIFADWERHYGKNWREEAVKLGW